MIGSIRIIFLIGEKSVGGIEDKTPTGDPILVAL